MTSDNLTHGQEGWVELYLSDYDYSVHEQADYNTITIVITAFLELVDYDYDYKYNDYENSDYDYSIRRLRFQLKKRADRFNTGQE